jgi:hypothetical protein
LVDFLLIPHFIGFKKVRINVHVLGGFQNDILGPQALSGPELPLQSLWKDFENQEAVSQKQVKTSR